MVADDLWSATSLRHSACCEHELAKLTVLAWADVKTTSKTHAERLMQRHSAALVSTTILDIDCVIDCLQALLLLMTNRMQRHHLQGTVPVWSALHVVHCVQDRV